MLTCTGEKSEGGDWNKLDGLIPGGNVMSGSRVAVRFTGRLCPRLKATSFAPPPDSLLASCQNGGGADARGPMAPARSCEKDGYSRSGSAKRLDRPGLTSAGRNRLSMEEREGRAIAGRGGGR